MQDKFDQWNLIKKQINNNSNQSDFFHEKEIWWCALGENIGVEINDKHDMFERPVLILKTFSNESLWIIPLISEEKIGIYYYKFNYGTGNKILNLSQLKLISSKRLLRKFDHKVSKEEFDQVKALLKAFL